MLKSPDLNTVMDLLDGMEPSARYQLNWVDVRKLLKSLALALAGFTLVLVTSTLANVDWESNAGWGTLLGAMAPVFLNYLRKLLAGPKVGTGTTRKAEPPNEGETDGDSS